MAEPERYSGEVVKWSDWRYILKAAPISLCYGISEKSKAKDVLTIHILLIQFKIFLTPSVT